MQRLGKRGSFAKVSTHHPWTNRPSSEASFVEPNSEVPEMVRVAIPIFKSRVSPAFDSCTRVLLIDLEKKREIERRELYLEGLSLSERVTLFQKLHITTVICGGISDVLHNMLEGAGIHTITGIAGRVEKVVGAFLSNRLNTPVFYMPGYTTKTKRVVGQEREDKGVIGKK